MSEKQINDIWDHIRNLQGRISELEKKFDEGIKDTALMVMGNWDENRKEIAELREKTNDYESHLDWHIEHETPKIDELKEVLRELITFVRRNSIMDKIEVETLKEKLDGKKEVIHIRPRQGGKTTEFKLKLYDKLPFQIEDSGDDYAMANNEEASFKFKGDEKSVSSYAENHNKSQEKDSCTTDSKLPEDKKIIFQKYYKDLLIKEFVEDLREITETLGYEYFIVAMKRNKWEEKLK